jgi:hypothetical protein
MSAENLTVKLTNEILQFTELNSIKDYKLSIYSDRAVWFKYEKDGFRSPEVLITGKHIGNICNFLTEKSVLNKETKKKSLINKKTW